MRYFLGSTVAAALAVPSLVPSAWPPWAEAVAWLFGVPTAGVLSTVVWRRFIRPALDDYILEATKRQRAEVGEWLRHDIFAEEFRTATARSEAVQEALSTANEALSVANATAQQLPAIAEQIGAVAALVRDVAASLTDFRTEMRKSLADAQLHGPYDRRVLPSTPPASHDDR